MIRFRVAGEPIIPIAASVSSVAAPGASHRRRCARRTNGGIFPLAKAMAPILVLFVKLNKLREISGSRLGFTSLDS